MDEHDGVIEVCMFVHKLVVEIEPSSLQARFTHIDDVVISVTLIVDDF